MTSAPHPPAYPDLPTHTDAVGLWSYRSSAPQLWADPVACSLMRCGPANSVQQWLQALDDRQAQSLQADMAQALASQAPFSSPVWLPGAAGQLLELRLRASWRQGEGGTQGELLGTVQVHSPQVPRQQASIAHLMHSNMVGMLVGRPDGGVVEANAYMLNLLGRTEGELDAGAMNWMRMTAMRCMDLSLRMRDLALRSGACPPFEKVFVRPDGSEVHVLMALAVLSTTEPQLLAIAVDISEQKKAEAELLALNAQLQHRSAQAERADAVKTLFLSSVSHELRTPLHTILGYVRLLRKKASAEVDEQLGIVERRAVDLLHLIDDLLEFNHTLVAPDKLRADYVDVEGFVRSLDSMFSSMAEHSGNQFELKLAPVLPVGIVQDEGRLVQVLRILVENACKYTADGRITLTMDSSSGLDADGRCRLYFAVQDTGRGIGQADQEHIFEPLRRGRNADDRPGLGLGLAIATQWVERMGGHIELQSQLGIGSCFGFELPVEAFFEPTPRWHAPRGLRPSAAMPLGRDDAPPLPPAELAMLGQLLSTGRLGRLGAWARALSASHPELRAVAEQVSRLAASAQVDALERLYQRCLEQAAGASQS